MDIIEKSVVLGKTDPTAPKITLDDVKKIIEEAPSKKYPESENKSIVYTELRYNLTEGNIRYTLLSGLDINIDI